MALYTTSQNATARLSRIAGLTVPAGVDLDLYISDASQIMEEYLGYEWASQANKEQLVKFSRSGQGKLLEVDGYLTKMTALNSITIPQQSLYFGYTISTSDIEWDAGGNLNLIALPIKHVWRSPILNLSDYPAELLVNYNTSPNSANPPVIFDQICCKLIAIMILHNDDSDSLISSKVDIKEMGLSTENTYKKNAMAEAMAPISRWRA